MVWHVCRSDPEALFTWRKQALGHFRSECATKNMTQLPAGLWTPKPTPTGDRNGGGILEGATAGHADAEQVGRPVSGSRGVTASDGTQIRPEDQKQVTQTPFAVLASKSVGAYPRDTRMVKYPQNEKCDISS